MAAKIELRDLFKKYPNGTEALRELILKPNVVNLTRVIYVKAWYRLWYE